MAASAAGNDRLLLLDTPSLYFRAFHGIPETIVGPDGTPVNALRGLLDFIGRLITDHRPTRLVAAMDADWRPAFRVKALPSYKAHRVSPRGGETVPDGLVPQIAVIEQLLDALGLARVGVAGYEADDVIGTVAAKADVPVDVVTGDRDLFQVVDDERQVRVLYTAARGVGRAEPVTEDVVAAKYGIPGRAYADFALLRGDPSDGLPGVPGIGEKTAAALITKYGSFEGLLAALADPSSNLGQRGKLAAAQEYLAAAPIVVRVARDVPLPPYDDRIPRTPKRPDVIVELSDRYNLDSPLSRVLAAFAKVSGQPTDE